MTPPEPSTDGRWLRLSPWTIVMAPIRAVPQFLPAGAGVVAVGVNNPRLLMLAVPLLLALMALPPWLFTRYRVTADHIQIRRGVVSKKVQTARRDRVRSVDLKANVLQRILRVSEVQIGTGEAESLHLASLSRPHAQALAQELLRRSPTGESGPAETVIAAFRPAWLRFSVFSLAGFAVVGAAVGFLSQFVADWLPKSWQPTVDGSVAAAQSVPLAVLIIGAVVVVAVVGVVASFAAYVVSYANFRLTRRSDGTLRVSRGLLTTMQASIEQKRIRGVSVREPLLMRIPQGAKASLIATGTDKNPLLMPPTFRAEVCEVAGDVVADHGALTEPLVDHGPVARRRRYTRAVWPVMVVAAVAAGIVVAVQAHWAWMLLAVIPLLAAPVCARLRWQHLGHAVTAQYVVAGRPQVGRTRDVVERDGVIGWSEHQSLFQRGLFGTRARVCTLSMVTAAGDGRYSLVDVTEDTAAEMVQRISGDWVATYLQSR